MHIYNRREHFYRTILGLMGHIIDLYAMARLTLVNPHSYTKFRIIQQLKRRTGATTCIETGTWHGITTARCSKIFQKVYSIEIDKGLVDKARLYLAEHKNIQILEGDALHLLPRLLADSDIDNVLIFLDGHFQGTTMGELAEPAVAVMPLLSPYKAKIRAVIIDDFRTFGSGPSYPLKSELLASIEQFFPGYAIHILFDQVIIEQHV